MTCLRPIYTTSTPAPWLEALRKNDSILCLCGGPYCRDRDLKKEKK